MFDEHDLSIDDEDLTEPVDVCFFLTSSIGGGVELSGKCVPIFWLFSASMLPILG